MDFLLEEQLQALILVDKFEEAVQMVEYKLKEYSNTPFLKMIGRDLLHQMEELEIYLESFISRLEHRISLKSVYAEMNGFSINHYLWFVDFFGYEVIGNTVNLDWLADWEDENVSTNPFIIKGFEEIQEIYKAYHHKEMYKLEEHAAAADVCDFAIILRLQELFRETILRGKSKNKKWAPDTRGQPLPMGSIQCHTYMY